MSEDRLADSLFEKLAERDATIAALRAEVERLERDAGRLLDKAEHDLRELGAWDNLLAGVPAGGVRSLIEDLRAAIAQTKERA